MEKTATTQFPQFTAHLFSSPPISCAVRFVNRVSQIRASDLHRTRPICVASHSEERRGFCDLTNGTGYQDKLFISVISINSRRIDNLIVCHVRDFSCGFQLHIGYYTC
ncbi:hypothetical protein ACS0TY_034294 [Phlomoides rotata]